MSGAGKPSMGIYGSPTTNFGSSGSYGTGPAIGKPTMGGIVKPGMGNSGSVPNGFGDSNLPTTIEGPKQPDIEEPGTEDVTVSDESDQEDIKKPNKPGKPGKQNKSLTDPNQLLF